MRFSPLFLAWGASLSATRTPRKCQCRVTCLSLNDSSKKWGSRFPVRVNSVARCRLRTAFGVAVATAAATAPCMSARAVERRLSGLGHVASPAFTKCNDGDNAMKKELTPKRSPPMSEWLTSRRRSGFLALSSSRLRRPFVVKSQYHNPWFEGVVNPRRHHHPRRWWLLRIREGRQRLLRDLARRFFGLVKVSAEIAAAGKGRVSSG